MDIFKYFRSSPPAPRQTTNPQAQGGFFGRFGMGFRGAPSMTGVRVDERTAFSLPAFYAGVSDITGSLSSIPLELFQFGKDGSARKATEHRAGTLFSRSPDGGNTTGMRIRTSLLMHSLVWGNGFCEIVPSVDGRKVYLFLMDPDRTQILMGSDSVIRYQYCGKTLERETVVNLPGLGFDGISGFPAVQLLKQALGLGIGATQYIGSYMGNSGGASGFFKPPNDLKKEDRDAFLKSYEERHSGPDQGGKVGMLYPGWDWVEAASGSNPASIELSKLRTECVLDVARILRLPAHRLGITDGQSYASIEIQNRSYIDGTLVPLAQNLEEALNLRLLTDEEVADGYTFRHSYDALLRADAVARTTRNRAMFASASLTPDEWRISEGFPPLGTPESSKTYAPLNMTTEPGAPADGK